MTLYQQQILSMAIVMAQREFKEKSASEDNLEEMDRWIEQFGLQFGISWKVSHKVEFPVDNSKPILTFSALVATPVDQVTVTITRTN